MLTKILDKTLVKVFCICNIGIPLLFRRSLLSFKCCDFKILEWPTNKKVFSKQSSIKRLFASFAFPMKRSFRVMILKMVTSCLSVSKLDATSTIDFAVGSGDRSESSSFVPTWRTKWSGFSLKASFKWSSCNVPWLPRNA